MWLFPMYTYRNLKARRNKRKGQGNGVMSKIFINYDYILLYESKMHFFFGSLGPPLSFAPSLTAISLFSTQLSFVCILFLKISSLIHLINTIFFIFKFLKYSNVWSGVVRSDICWQSIISDRKTSPVLSKTSRRFLGRIGFQ